MSSHIGEVTANILRFNTPERLLKRHVLIASGRYPSPAVKSRMSGK